MSKQNKIGMALMQNVGAEIIIRTENSRGVVQDIRRIDDGKSTVIYKRDPDGTS